MDNTVELHRFLKKLGLRLRKLRNQRGWTLEETEEHGWNNWQHLQKIEAGKKNIGISTLLRLAKLYKLELSELLKNVE
jgi:XRE family transcriptional regulator, regulator of sulfur utilization